MRIRMLVDMPEGASRNGEPWPKLGDVTEMPTAEAAHLCAAGVAEQVDDTTAPAGNRRNRARQKDG